MRRARSVLAMAAIGLMVPAAPAVAAPAAGPEVATASPVFATYSGEIVGNQVGKTVVEVPAADFTMAGTGRVQVAFTLEAGPGSSLDPGAIVVRSLSGLPPIVSVPYRLNTPGGNASYTVASLAPNGRYEVRVRGERSTVGTYRLTAHLFGDANGDFRVNQDDLALINSLNWVRHGNPAYSPWADVDRNGVINGLDRLAATFNLGAATRLRPEAEENPLDEELPADALALDGLDPYGFNPLGTPVAYSLAHSEFHDDPAEMALTVNGNAVPVNRITVEPQRVTATGALVNGRNELNFAGVDAVGRPVYHRATVWAGANNLRVTVVDETGARVTDEVVVRVSLTDDQAVHAEATTTTGELVFTNVPSRTVLVKATASGNRLGTVGLYAGDGAVQVRLLGFGTPSPVQNNDFSQGTDGWEIGNAPVWIVEHEEGIPGQAGVAAGPQVAAARGVRDGTPPMAPAAETGEVVERAGDATTASIVNNDLVLGTSGEGERSISRTFITEPDVTAIRIRYRFITSEVPGGWFGSQYNDYFRVSLRSQQGGGAAAEANSMNGLGLGEFHYGSGATGWRDLVLPVDNAGDVIQVNLGVANVADALYDSRVVVDFVEEVRDQVQPALTWNSTQGGMDLRYTVEGSEPLQQDATIEVHWANGAGYANRQGAAIFTHTVPAGTAPGSYGPVRIAGNLLADNPTNVTHLLASTGPTRVAALADVQVNFGANADANSLSATTIDIVKDSLRAAGARTATITSTARTPADQARAMFQNLTNPARSVAQNVANQLALYAAAGDAVINVFVAQTQGMTREQILANSATIRAAMVAEINNQGPQNVSRHCADPNVVNVADIGASAFNASNGPLFVAAIRPRVTRLLDERNSNNCYHIEVVQ
jgi:hypothetical protein